MPEAKGRPDPRGGALEALGALYRPPASVTVGDEVDRFMAVARANSKNKTTGANCRAFAAGVPAGWKPKENP
jgi:hypothetical protein